MIDDPLAPDVRALLAAGRDRLGPDAATTARLRSRVDAVVASAPASGAVLARPLAWKLVAIAMIGSGVYVAREVTGHGGHGVEAMSPTVESRETDVDIAPRVLAVSPENSSPRVEQTTSESLAVASQTIPSATGAREQPTESDRARPAIVPTRAGLAREIELVDQATLALRNGQLEPALVVLRTYGEETAGEGQLAQDATALRVEALCRTRAATAVSELEAFRTRWPQSAQHPHLNTVCSKVKP